MSDKITISQQPKLELLATDRTRELEVMAVKLMKLAQGARRLNSTEAAELAVASMITGANPFAMEIYHAGSMGIMFGIEWFKRRGHEALYAELGRVGRIIETYRPATHAEAMFDDAKDVAWTVAITDTATQEEHLGKVTKLFETLTAKGIPGADAWKFANDTIGPCPTWEASAVVYGDEGFEGKYSVQDEKEGKGKAGEAKPQKWDRNERCKKRCLKWALKKRFSSMELPDVDDSVVIDASAREIASAVAAHLLKEESERPTDPAVIVQQFGYEPQPAPPQPAPPAVVSSGPVRPYTPEYIKAMVDKKATTKYAQSSAPQILAGILARAIETTLGGETQRHEMLKWLIGTASLKEAAPGQLLAIQEWTGIRDFNQMPSDQVIAELHAVHAAALNAAGQMAMDV